MSRKTFLSTTCCLVVFSLSITSALAQQKKAERGKLLMIESAPRRGGDPSLINIARRSLYRTYDGRNNNITSLQNAEFGAAGILLHRELAQEYG